MQTLPCKQKFGWSLQSHCILTPTEESKGCSYCKNYHHTGYCDQKCMETHANRYLQRPKRPITAFRLFACCSRFEIRVATIIADNKNVILKLWFWLFCTARFDLAKNAQSSASQGIYQLIFVNKTQSLHNKPVERETIYFPGWEWNKGSKLL